MRKKMIYMKISVLYNNKRAFYEISNFSYCYSCDDEIAYFLNIKVNEYRERLEKYNIISSAGITTRMTTSFLLIWRNVILWDILVICVGSVWVQTEWLLWSQQLAVWRTASRFWTKIYIQILGTWLKALNQCIRHPFVKRRFWPTNKSKSA